MANAGVPDGLIAMEPSKASHTAEDFPVLCTDECTDQKDAEKSGSVLHHATPAALPDHKPLLLLQEGKVNAIQRHTTGLYLGRLPSSSTTNKKDVAVLSHSRIDSAPEVFGEMPTSGTGYVYCPEHHNISLNTCVLDRNGNLSEQNIDDMPQASGFHNLNCKSVVLEPMFAVYEDETDSSSSEFFDVSATDRLQSQPFEQLPVFDVYDDDTEGFSNVSIDVCATIPKQQPYEDTQQGSGQSPKCFSMPIFSPETPTVGIDIDQLLNCPCEASECGTCDEEYQGDDNSLWEKSVCQTATRRYISLFPWDPGASLPLMLGKTQHSSQALQPATHATIFTGSSASRFSGCTCLPFRVQYNMYVLWKSEISMTTYISWDPGILHYMAPNGSNSVLQDNSFIMQRAAPLSEYGCFADQKLMANTSSKVAALTLLAAPLKLLSSTTYIWDPVLSIS